jgi:uncharacterized protein YndB with AHSA1/START domain
MGKTAITAEPGTSTIDIVREFDAPRDLVFKAWTEPDLLVRWLGGTKLKMEIDTYEVRDGGRWRYIHTDEHGAEYAFHGVFHGTPTPDKLIQTFEFEGWPGQVSLESMVLEEQGGTTVMRNRAVYQSVEARDAMISSGMEEGMNAGFDALDALLPTLTSQG